MGIFMQYGSKIKGDVTSDGHKGWINLMSFQFGVGRGIASPSGSGENRTASTASVSEITITKLLDPSSNSLVEDMLKGGLDTDVQIDFTETKANKAFLTYKLTNTGISGWSISSGGDRPSESVSLNFTKIEINNVKKDPTGADDPHAITYDLSQQKMV